MIRKRALLAAATAFAAVPTVSLAELTANVGYVSDYIYRGIFQEDSSVSGGVDYEDDSGFYVGVWGADVGLGIETDLYFGYSGSTDGGLGYSIGWTGYFYSEDGAPSSAEPGFYDTITEVNLGISYDIFSLDHAIGEEDGWGSPTDYTFTTVTVAPEVGPYYSYNTFGDQYDGAYLEIGYGWTAVELDWSVAFMYALDAGEADNVILLSESESYADTTVTLGVSKTFTFGD